MGAGRLSLDVPTSSLRENGVDTVPTPHDLAVGRWSKVGSKVKLGLAFSGSFKTLRDQHGINEIELSQLKTVKKLGEGAFAIVEQCEYTPVDGGTPRMVAVKKLKPDVVSSSQEDLEAFFKEVAVVRKLKHKQVVEYIGIGCTDHSSEKRKQESMFMVQVSSQMGVPHKRLYSNQDALRWMIQIAEALEYLHGANPIVIHRDLKLENILLTAGCRKEQEAKLSDFGLATFKRAAVKQKYATTDERSSRPSRLQDVKDVSRVEEKWNQATKAQIQRMSSLKKQLSILPASGGGAFSSQTLRIANQLSGRTGTLMYMAPEMFRLEPYNEKVDVFSFAIIMYEVFHRYMMLMAISVAGTEEEIEAYAERVASGYRPPIADNFPLELRSLIEDAWHPDPSQRPDMSEVARRLKALRSQGLLGEESEPDIGCQCVVC